MSDLEDRLTKIEHAMEREAGTRSIVRWASGVAVSIALGLGGAAVSYASQAASDHVRVTEHETTLREMSATLVEVRSTLAATQAVLERVEHRLDREAR